jgi:hypothetical protein
MASRFVLGDYLQGALWGLPVRASRYPSGYLFGLLSGSCGFWRGMGFGWLGGLAWGLGMARGSFGCLLLLAIHETILLIRTR